MVTQREWWCFGRWLMVVGRVLPRTNGRAEQVQGSRPHRMSLRPESNLQERFRDVKKAQRALCISYAVWQLPRLDSRTRCRCRPIQAQTGGDSKPRVTQNDAQSLTQSRCFQAWLGLAPQFPQTTTPLSLNIAANHLTPFLLTIADNESHHDSSKSCHDFWAAFWVISLRSLALLPRGILGLAFRPAIRHALRMAPWMERRGVVKSKTLPKSERNLRWLQNQTHRVSRHVKET